MSNISYPIRNENAWWALLGNDITAKKVEILKHISSLRARGKIIYPADTNIMNALRFTSPEDVKVVILGQDPYHEVNQAMGLSFSVPDGTALPPSLINIFNELSSDLHCEKPISGDLSNWAKQGVLLLNTVLTVEAHKANSHRDLGWQDITKAIIKACIKMPQPIVFLCWGGQAVSTLESVINETWGMPPNHVILKSSHPSPFSAYNNSARWPAFIGSKPFSKANAFLTKFGSTPINWTL